MVTEAGKELLRNTINTAKFHNRILEENEMWKQWELECGLTMMVSDDDIIKRIKKSHQCSKHRRRDKSRSRDSSRSKYEIAKVRQGTGSSSDRWDHSGFAELYPDAAVPDKYPSTSSSFSNLNKHKKKKRKKSRHRSNSSDKEIWEEFKRYKKSKKDKEKLKSDSSKRYDSHIREWNKPAEIWNKERTLRLIELLRDAPALWNINYPGYRDQRVKLRETKRIATKFRIDEDEITKQIEFLMNEFHEEHKKMTLKRLKGNCAKNSENEWFAYKHLTFLIKNKTERFCKTVESDLSEDENPQWVDSSDSYSDSDDETSTPPPTDLSRCCKNKIKDEKREEHGKKGPDLPYVQAYMAQKDSYSVYGEIIAHRMREAKKSSKSIERAEKEIDMILRKLEIGFFDTSPEIF